MFAYRMLKGLYHRVPARVRTFLWYNPLTRGPREWIIRRAEKLAAHDELYTRQYFQTAVDPQAAASAPAMVASMVQELRPASVVDVGCGTGQILLSFQKSGVSGRGLEYSDAALEICRERGLDVQKFDLEQEAQPSLRADLVVSTEVAEHLPPRCADRYVDLLCSIADTAFITAAIPGQTGTDHVNEQPNAYWIEKFAQRSFGFEEEQSHRWRREWAAANVAPFYRESAMLFKRRGKGESSVSR
jgi:SAM-dependent methyltransferase